MPVRQITAASSTLIVWTPATTSSPASAGIGTRPTTWPNATTIASRKSPERIVAQPSSSAGAHAQGGLADGAADRDPLEE